MPKMITIGETMAAFVPGASGPIRYVGDYRMRSAGAESNTAIGVAKLGVDAAWLSRVGNDEFGLFLRNQIRSEGVDCTKLIFDKDHATGVMFKEQSVSETKVYYYRENSAASHLSASDLTPVFFENADLLHMTGITPVLSRSCEEMTHAAFAMAKEKGLKISFDPNIRKKLWKNRDYTPLLKQLIFQSDIVLMGIDEAEILFGTRDRDKILEKLFTEGNIEYVALKDGGRGAVVASAKESFEIPPYPCKCVEPIGAGDGFNAGFITGILKQKELELCGRMGGICGALATQCPGDVEGYPDEMQLELAINNQAIVYR